MTVVAKDGDVVIMALDDDSDPDEDDEDETAAREAAIAEDEAETGPEDEDMHIGSVVLRYTGLSKLMA